MQSCIWHHIYCSINLIDNRFAMTAEISEMFVSTKLFLVNGQMSHLHNCRQIFNWQHDSIISISFLSSFLLKRISLPHLILEVTRWFNHSMLSLTWKRIKSLHLKIYIEFKCPSFMFMSTSIESDFRDELARWSHMNFAVTLRWESIRGHREHLENTESAQFTKIHYHSSYF